MRLGILKWTFHTGKNQNLSHLDINFRYFISGLTASRALGKQSEGSCRNFSLDFGWLNLSQAGPNSKFRGSPSLRSGHCESRGAATRGKERKEWEGQDPHLPTFLQDRFCNSSKTEETVLRWGREGKFGAIGLPPPTPEWNWLRSCVKRDCL